MRTTTAVLALAAVASLGIGSAVALFGGSALGREAPSLEAGCDEPCVVAQSNEAGDLHWSASVEGGVVHAVVTDSTGRTVATRRGPLVAANGESHLDESPLGACAMVLQGGPARPLNHHFESWEARHAVDLQPSDIESSPVFAPVAGRVIALHRRGGRPQGSTDISSFREVDGWALLDRGDDEFLFLGHIEVAPDLRLGAVLAVGDVVGATFSSAEGNETHLHIHAFRLGGSAVEPLALRIPAGPHEPSIPNRPVLRADILRGDRLCAE